MQGGVPFNLIAIAIRGCRCPVPAWLKAVMETRCHWCGQDLIQPSARQAISNLTATSSYGNAATIGNMYFRNLDGSAQGRTLARQAQCPSGARDREAGPQGLQPRASRRFLRPLWLKFRRKFA